MKNTQFDEVTVRIQPLAERIQVESRKNGLVTVKEILPEDVIKIFGDSSKESKIIDSGFLPDKVTVIPATPIRLFPDDIQQTAKRRVAAYARVSTDKEEQHNSFEAQCDYFAKYIAARPEWEFVKVYAEDADIIEPTRRNQ